MGGWLQLAQMMLKKFGVLELDLKIGKLVIHLESFGQDRLSLLIAPLLSQFLRSWCNALG